MKYLAFALALFFKSSECLVQNCTTSPCDLNCAGSALCTQSCYAKPCQTTCTSTGGCDAKCPLGGCSKMSCDVAQSTKKECSQVCQKDCGDMNCKSFICRPECEKDNCAITCEGSSMSNCYPKCHGKNCKINCKSMACEAQCSGGGCTVKFAKGSSGTLYCSANCTYICATGSRCTYTRSCPGCSGPTYVDDPFAVPTTTSNPATTNPATTKPATTKPGNAASHIYFLGTLPFLLLGIICARV